MNKKLLAVALATAFAAPAMAEGVQMYGAFDVGVLVRGDAYGAQRGDGTQSQVASGMNGHNGLGVRMSEDLGNGMKISGDAFFTFALDTGNNGAGLGSNNGSGGLNTLYSYLALSGDFGTLIAGRAGGARAGFIKQYDPFGGFGVGNALQVQNSVRGNADYADNVLAWITPEVLPGLKVLAAYTTNLVGQDLTGRRTDTNALVPVATPLYAIAGLYNQGPVSLTVAYENLSLDGLSALAAVKETGHSAVWTTGGSYDFGVAKVMALWTQVEHYQHGWQVGATAPLSEATTLKVGYASAKNNLDNVPGTAGECSKYAAGINHDLSKRTRLYADVARLSEEEGCTTGINTNGGTYSVNAGQGLDQGVGFGKWGTNVGIRHSF
jgi:predicted porin